MRMDDAIERKIKRESGRNEKGRRRMRKEKDVRNDILTVGSVRERYRQMKTYLDLTLGFSWRK